MNDSTRKRKIRLAHILTALLAIIFASVVTGWAATDAPGFNPAISPAVPAEIELRPPAPKPRLVIPGEILAGVPSDIAQTRLLAESRCLAEVMYYEARGEGEIGEIAVAEVILNRLAGGEHGPTICSVVYEGFDQTFCQFTFVCDGSRDRAKLPEPWRASQVLAARLLAGQIRHTDETDGATNYHSTSVHASWDAEMTRVARIGNHVFYKAPPLQSLLPDRSFRGSLQ
jgi:hypothetical protein